MGPSASMGSSATASTGSSPHWTRPATRSNSSSPGVRSPPPSRGRSDQSGAPVLGAFEPSTQQRDHQRRQRTQNVPELAYANYADALGLRGIRAEKPEQIGPAWEEALASDRPCVSDAVTDANVPTLPPHITMSQAPSYAKALATADLNEVERPGAGKVALPPICFWFCCKEPSVPVFVFGRPWDQWDEEQQ